MILVIALIWVAMEKRNFVICNQGVTSSNLVAGTSFFNDLTVIITPTGGAFRVPRHHQVITIDRRIAQRCVVSGEEVSSLVRARSQSLPHQPEQGSAPQRPFDSEWV
jgi:hypothetical protein